MDMSILDKIKSANIGEYIGMKLSGGADSSILYYALCKHIKDNNLDTRVPMPEPVFSVWGSSNPNYDSQKYRYGYTSLTAPTSYYEYEIASNESTLLKEIEVFGLV